MPSKRDSSAEQDKVLDLLDATPKPSRRERQRKEAVVAPVIITPSKLDKAKSDALDLFSEEKKAKTRKPIETVKTGLKSISKILAREDPAMVKAPLPAPAPPVTPVTDADPLDEFSPDDPKLIIIKPPILIPELAARLGLKSFNIMADLIKLGVFPAPNQPLEPDIAAKICESHGLSLIHI